MKKVITAGEKLQAFALFAMAVNHHNEAQRYERAIARLFNNKDEYIDHVHAIYGNDAGPTMTAFEAVLEKIGIKVSAAKKRK